MTKAHKRDARGAVAVRYVQSRNTPVARLNGCKQYALLVTLVMSYKIEKIFHVHPPSALPPSPWNKPAVPSYGANRLNLPPMEPLTTQQAHRLQGP